MYHAANLQPAETNFINGLPSNISGGGIDPGIVNKTTNDFINTGGDPNKGAQVLGSAISSASAVSVSKAFATACTYSSAKASAFSESFAQLCINAVQSKDVVYSFKCVSSFSVSIVLLVVTGQTAVAKTCVSSFTTYVIQQGGCATFVTVIIQTFIQVIVSISAPTATFIFG